MNEHYQTEQEYESARRGENDIRPVIAKFASMTDEQLFAKGDHALCTWTDEEAEALKAERQKRKLAKEHEQQAVEQAKLAHILAAKNAIQYSDRLAEEICVRISTGELLIAICREEHMPTLLNCHHWLKGHADFKDLYDESIRDRMKVFEEQVIEIADDMKNDFRTIIKNGKEKKVADPDMVARAKLRIEVRFRHLKAYKPERWGEATTLNVKSQDSLDPGSMSADELEARIADIESKTSTVRNAA
jgi:hypothetical protein